MQEKHLHLSCGSVQGILRERAPRANCTSGGSEGNTLRPLRGNNAFNKALLNLAVSSGVYIDT